MYIFVRYLTVIEIKFALRPSIRELTLPGISTAFRPGAHADTVGKFHDLAYGARFA